jgi:hypothetical protein
MQIPYGPTSSDETRAKLRELILYISDRCKSDEHYGMIKLNKIILQADRLSYVRYGKAITETAYMRLSQGLVPYHMIQILEQMKEDRDIVVREKQRYQYVQKRVVSLRDADLEPFTATDIALIEEVISECESYDAHTMSHRSHGTAWHIAGDRETVPYSAFLLSDNQTATEADVMQAYELIERHGWDVRIHA